MSEPISIILHNIQTCLHNKQIINAEAILKINKFNEEEMRLSFMRSHHSYIYNLYLIEYFHIGSCKYPTQQQYLFIYLKQKTARFVV